MLTHEQIAFLEANYPTICEKGRTLDVVFLDIENHIKTERVLMLKAYNKLRDIRTSGDAGHYEPCEVETAIKDLITLKVDLGPSKMVTLEG